MQKMRIDLTKMHLEDAEQQVLAKLIQQFLINENQTKLRKDSAFTLNDTDSPIKVTLSHSILKIQDLDEGSQLKDSFLILGELIGRGSTGRVKLVTRKVELNSEHETVTLKPMEERVVKRSTCVKMDDIQKERNITQSVFSQVSKVVSRDSKGKTKTYFAMPKKGEMELAKFSQDFHEPNQYTDEQLAQRKKFLLLICLNLVKVLQALHEKNILHRDIKPQNIRINPETGEVWLVDFGASEERDNLEDFFDQNSLGSPFYGAPEILHKTNEGYLASKKIDYYALGISLVVVLIGMDSALGPNEAYRDVEDRYNLRRGKKGLEFDFYVFQEKMNELGLAGLAQTIMSLGEYDQAKRPEDLDGLKELLKELNFFESKLQTKKLHEIREENFYQTDPKQRASFNQYVVDNLDNVIKQQVRVYELEDEVPRPRSPISVEVPVKRPLNLSSRAYSNNVSQTEETPNAKEAMAKQLLLSIEAIILETKWSVGWFGGETVDVFKDENKQKTIKVSSTHLAVLNAISEVQKNSQSSWVEALKEVTDKARKQSQKNNYKDKVWFFGRSKGTQEFYTKLGDANQIVESKMGAAAA